ncbi:4Fe-4S dicluster domain-containing protein [Thermoanaerobacteraceae bacterium SP2]|nr:4Fe-4S dicluster domain-containing protein [Thermoanaerobacteraceae bacterium SP2]
MKDDFATSIGIGIYSINTGDWRVQRPVKEDNKCNRCGICFLYCPVFSIQKKEKEYVIDLSYCKGCGICAKECPKSAISMMPEGGK